MFRGIKGTLGDNKNKLISHGGKIGEIGGKLHEEVCTNEK